MALKRGRDILVKLDTNFVGGAGASWVSIGSGQQADGGFNMETETADGRTKVDAGWPNDLIVGQSWSVSCEGKLDPSGSTWTALYNAWQNGTKCWIQVDMSGASGFKKEGQAIVKLSIKFSDKDAVSFTADFTGQGQPITSP